MQLAADGLGVTYGDVVALRGFDLSCGPREFVGVFGRGGAGKTSLLHALAGVVPCSGVVRLDGTDVSGDAVAARASRGLVLCPERRRVFAASSGLDNLRMGAHRASRAQSEATLQFVFSVFPALAAPSVHRRPAGRLSSGEQQMLAIGRALMAQPKVLLVDEPLMSVSPLLAPSLVEAMARIRDEWGVGVVVAERSGEPWEGVVDRAYVLERPPFGG